ncbi:MAG TPA: hypothetical protein VGX25_06550 [Actinophytocola sp.]|uniref:hypothetical protein n=1 Tax=Actinophytocola sp. TaxID=1872138 RepID=UPI002DDD2BD9|nr:hypothetical protein [Actinophytocola sp.]HEV2779047.1 hypothetical protein [Actinophytocola sp.]
MYVDETGDDTTTDTTAGDDELTVEVDGETYEVEETHDFDSDGHNDTAVVETEDGYIAFADTNHDGTADVAVEFDQDGNVVAGAEYDESTGEWVEEDVNSLPTPSGDGADDGPSDSGDDSRDSDSGSTTETGSDDSSSDRDSDSDDGTITVETPRGEVEAGEAEYDMDGDGKNDTAVVTDSDGTTYAFTDEDGDGTADTAVVIEADGDVTVAENTGGDNWEVTEQGHINADGTYESEPSSGAGSDAVWAESR